MPRNSLLARVLYFGPRLIFTAFFMYLLAVMVLGNFDLFEPYLYPLHAAQNNMTYHGKNITIGHYPRLQELKKLRRERGVEIDISLLDQNLMQEKALNRSLEENARTVGIQMIRYPLNYTDLNSEGNKRVIADIAEFVSKNSSKHIYIHCYLGRHRAGLVRTELLRQGLIAAAQ